MHSAGGHGVGSRRREGKTICAARAKLSRDSRLCQRKNSRRGQIGHGRLLHDQSACKRKLPQLASITDYLDDYPNNLPTIFAVDGLENRQGRSCGREINLDRKIETTDCTDFTDYERVVNFRPFTYWGSRILDRASSLFP